MASAASMFECHDVYIMFAVSDLNMQHVDIYEMAAAQAV